MILTEIFQSHREVEGKGERWGGGGYQFSMYLETQNSFLECNSIGRKRLPAWFLKVQDEEQVFRICQFYQLKILS